MLNFEVLAFWIETTEVGTECHEKDKCYLQIKNLWPKPTLLGGILPPGCLFCASAILCLPFFDDLGETNDF